MHNNLNLLRRHWAARLSRGARLPDVLRRPLAAAGGAHLPAPAAAPSGCALPSGAAGRIEGPTVEISLSVYARLRAYVDGCPNEISGFGLVRVTGDNLVVTNVGIARQYCSATQTEISEDGLAGFLDELLDRGEDPGDLLLWWHSHAEMEVFWSPTDLHTLATTFPQAGWVLGLVLNRRGAITACLHMARPVPLRLYELPVRLQFAADAALQAEVGEEIRQKVSGFPLCAGPQARPWPPEPAALWPT
jgi:hypothetical protein